MPAVIDNPIAIPARTALSADHIAVERLTIERLSGADLWSAVATVTFYAETEAGPVFARDDAGQLVTETVSTQNLFATAAEMPAVAVAAEAIVAAVVAMRAAKAAALAAEQQEQPQEQPQGGGGQ